MFNIFSKPINIIKWHDNLPPAERIKTIFEEQVSPLLNQYGFTFISSKSIFKRKTGPFTQEIIISKSKWNKADKVCAFWLAFNISADDYETWHRQKYGVSPLNISVDSFYHNHLKNWATEFPLNKYDLSIQDNSNVFSEIKINLINVIIPSFENYSTYEKAADTLLEKKEYWWGAKIIDYYLISGKEDKAKNALKICNDFFDNETDMENQRPEQFHSFLLRKNLFQ